MVSAEADCAESQVPNLVTCNEPKGLLQNSFVRWRKLCYNSLSNRDHRIKILKFLNKLLNNVPLEPKRELGLGAI
jgi:hypothetical protein